MTRKDFELIAGVFRDYRRARIAAGAPNDDGYAVGARDAARAMADALAKEFPRFDRARFLKACEVEEIV